MRSGICAARAAQRRESGCERPDVYGRELGIVLCDGKDVGLGEIHDGLAWFDEPYVKELREDDRTHQAVEANARAARRGLWKQKNPQAPWESRRAKRSK